MCVGTKYGQIQIWYQAVGPWILLIWLLSAAKLRLPKDSNGSKTLDLLSVDKESEENEKKAPQTTLRNHTEVSKLYYSVGVILRGSGPNMVRTSPALSVQAKQIVLKCHNR